MNAPPEPVATRARVIIPFIIVTLIWGSTWLVIKDQLGVVPASWSIAYRFFAASLAMFLVVVLRRERLWLDASGMAFAAVLGMMQFVLNFNFVYRAEGHVTSGLVSVVFALMIVPNAILGRIFLKQRVGGTFFMASAIAIVGVALLFVQEARGDSADPGETLMGVGLTFCAILCASIANIMQGTERARRYPMLTVLAWGMLIGSIADSALAWFMTGPPVWDARPAYIGGVLYLGLIGSALAFPLYFSVIRAIGPAMAAYSGVLVPVIAMLLSTIFEGYRWSTLAIFGAALTMTGLVIALRARRPVR
ncbi:EamA family transporter [Sphingobium boeckii]|uniref:Drug/metabolite transporter (DMT)-like permease n=1 Tax=Sphingobium boeckii TaxID=1082345 RepID=A0A7W9EEM6_9SPHN|nr:drug/metabolite transporter (DMT)-like permease [Sphingobium boeckii]